jgi:hypothetical protein
MAASGHKPSSGFCYVVPNSDSAPNGFEWCVITPEESLETPTSIRSAISINGAKNDKAYFADHGTTTIATAEGTPTPPYLPRRGNSRVRENRRRITMLMWQLNG